MSRFLNTPAGKAFMKTAAAVNIFVYRVSGGRMMNRVAGCPICLVTMTGAKTGRRRTLPLMYTAHGDDVLLLASLGGAPKHPVWYYNLKAYPDIEIQIGRRRRRMRAREAGAEERAKLWSVAVASYPPFASYQKKTDRQIPIFVCSES